MNEAKKPIKYLAIALALFIIFTIVSGIIFMITVSINLFGNKETNESLKETEVNNKIKNLNIDLLTTKLIIKKGDKLTFETNNDHITVDEGSNKLYIKEETHNILFKNNNYELIIYIPNEMVFDEIEIEASAGSINIDRLNTNTLNLELGAGSFIVDELNVYNKAKINGGAGKITINKSNINNLELDMGVGKLELTTTLTGKNKIDAGVGQVDINLEGTDYTIDIDKGMGSTLINDKKINDDTTFGDGNSYLEIDGGVGSININTNEIINLEINEQFEMTIDKYLKSVENEIIIIGTIEKGTTDYKKTIKLLDNNGDVISTAKISDKNPGLYEKELKDAKPNDKISIILENITEEDIIKTKKIIAE